LSTTNPTWPDLGSNFPLSYFRLNQLSSVTLLGNGFQRWTFLFFRGDVHPDSQQQLKTDCRWLTGSSIKPRHEPNREHCHQWLSQCCMTSLPSRTQQKNSASLLFTGRCPQRPSLMVPHFLLWADLLHYHSLMMTSSKISQTQLVII
jgi:hypothetical protein